MAALPQELARGFEAAAAGLPRPPTGSFASSAAGMRQSSQLTFNNGQSMRARRLVLALPRPAVDALAATRPSCVSPRSAAGWCDHRLSRPQALPLVRTAVVARRRLQRPARYDRPPLRKTFYLDSSEATDTPGQALLLAAFADGTDLDAWQSLPALAGGAPTLRPRCTRSPRERGRGPLEKDARHESAARAGRFGLPLLGCRLTPDGLAFLAGRRRLGRRQAAHRPARSGGAGVPMRRSLVDRAGLDRGRVRRRP